MLSGRSKPRVRGLDGRLGVLPVFRKERIKETYGPESHRSSVMPKPPAESLLDVGVNNTHNFTRLGSFSLSSDTITLVGNCPPFLPGTFCERSMLDAASWPCNGF